MDDRTMTALTTGVLLLGASAQRAERAAERSMRAGVTRRLHLASHTWIRRADRATAGAGGAVALVILVYANQRLRREARRTDGVDAG